MWTRLGLEGGKDVDATRILGFVLAAEHPRAGSRLFVETNSAATAFP